LRFFEPRFGVDLSGVRVHHDGGAARLAASVNARAFTVGRDVFFGEGEWAPGTARGDRLLAHELTHTIQPAHPLTAHRQPAGLEAEQAPPPADLGCEAGDPAPYEAVVAVTFPKDSVSVPETDQQWLAQVARDWHQSETYSDIRIDGYASAEGVTDYNWHLSCRRARAVEQALLYPLMEEYEGVPPAYINRIVAHGETDVFAEDPAANRVATITISGLPISDNPVAPVPPPPCPTWEEWVGSDVAGFFADMGDCFCLPISFIDLFDDAAAKLPLVGKPLSTDLGQGLVSWADCLCGVFNFLQLAWNLGRDPGPCWDPAHFSAVDLARLGGLAVAVGVDCGAGPIAGALTSWVQEATAALVVEVGSMGGPHTAVAAFFIGHFIGGFVERLSQEGVEFALDVGSMIAQNYLITGTPFPLDGCRACLDLAARVSARVDTTLCDWLVGAVTPDMFTFGELRTDEPAMAP
jgi:outer membrane protein OmpA-like peptidoglycan-associated protein